MPRFSGLLIPRRFIFRLACILAAFYLLLSCARHVSSVRDPRQTHNLKQTLEIPSSASDPIPVIIYAFNRADNLRLTIQSVLAAVPSPSLHPIFISQDGNDSSVAAVIASYGERVTHLHYQLHCKPGDRKPCKTYFRIASHYRFALSEVMDRVVGHERWNRVIMLEDDMLVSPDFFAYFQRMSPLFDIDSTLYCVSAWNENGQSQFVNSSTAVYRTDSFPGLGWMWSRDLWEEQRQWTSSFWDDWLREPAQRKRRSRIYPETNRVYTFGSEGASHGKFFDRWFKDIQLNREDVEWDSVDVSHLLQYDDWIRDHVLKAVRVSDIEEAKSRIDTQLAADAVTGAIADADEMLVEYGGLSDLTELMQPIGLMSDHKAGLPRASYKGVLQYRYRQIRIWIVPNSLALLLP